MQSSRHDTLPQWLQTLLIVGLLLIIILMPFHAFLSTWAGSVFGMIELWKSWKELLLVVLAVPIVVWLSIKPYRWRQLLDDPFAWWLLAFVGIVGFLSALYHDANGAAATLAGLASTGRYFLMFALAYTVFRFGTWRWTTLRDRLVKYLVYVGVFVSLLGVLQVHVLPLDFLSNFGYDKGTTIAPYTLIDENMDAPRAFATLRGPNDFAAYLIIPLVLACLLARRNKWWYIAAGIIIVGIFESSSRSAWVGTVIALLAFVVLVYGRAIVSSRRWRIGIAVSILAAIVTGFAALSIPAVRLEVFHSSPDDTSLTEGSTDNHWLATSSGIMRVVMNPVGCGAGCAGPASYYGDNPRISESYPVQIAEETGISGLILWVGIALMVGVRLWRQRQDYVALGLLASFIGLNSISLVLHTWADDPLSLTWWGLAGITLGFYAGSRYDKQEQTHAKRNKHGKKAKQEKVFPASS